MWDSGMSSDLSSWGCCCSLIFCPAACCEHQRTEDLDGQHLDGPRRGLHASGGLSILFLSVTLENPFSNAEFESPRLCTQRGKEMEGVKDGEKAFRL